MTATRGMWNCHPWKHNLFFLTLILCLLLVHIHKHTKKVGFEITCTSHHVLTPRVNQQTKTIIIFIIIDRLWSLYTIHDYSFGLNEIKAHRRQIGNGTIGVMISYTMISIFMISVQLSIAISLVIIITALLCYLLVSHGISRSPPL